MNQDSDQDRSSGSEPRRDGERRSFGRRDDARSNDQPRFSRNSGNTDKRDERPSRSDDRPRFGRDRNDSDRRDDRPRFSRDDNRRSDGPRSSDDRPRRNDGRSSGGYTPGRSPRFDNDRRDSRPGDGDRNRRGPSTPRFDTDRNRNDDRPRFSRDDRPGSFDQRNRTDSPRFDRDRRDERPSRDTNTDRFGSDRRFSERSPDRDRNPDSQRPAFNRDRPDRNAGSNQRPRFDRSSDFDRNNGGSGDRGNGPRPRFSRDDRPTDGDRPRFDRDRKSNFEKPSFKRVGGFSREADERNNDRRAGRDTDPRGETRSDNKSRFTPEQRKESGERRTGFFVKAPNYNLEQRREDSSFGRSDKPRRDRNDRTTADQTRDEKRGPSDPSLTRLNRYIANSGVCSRREADELIAQGDISVNGKVITEMGYKVKEGDTVKYGTKVLNPERFVYVLLNKPKDYITTTDDPEERKTVMELVADAGNFRMYPVGRLDRNTTGLLLLTNDGELADKLTHPSNNIRKIYQAELDKPITTEHFEAIQKGFDLEDGPIKPDAMSIITPDGYVVGIEIHSGRNRVVRRMFEHFGYEVSKLDRTTYAGLTKKELPRGKWRFLDPKEVIKLKYLNS